MRWAIVVVALAACGRYGFGERVGPLGGDGGGGDGNRGTDGPGSTGTYTVGLQPRGIGIADFTGDGKLDIAVALGGGGVALLSGDGAGGFGAATSSDSV